MNRKTPRSGPATLMLGWTLALIAATVAGLALGLIRSQPGSLDRPPAALVSTIPLPTETATMTSETPTMLVVLVASATLVPTQTPAPPSTPHLLPTATPLSLCGPWIPVGNRCTWAGPPPTSAPLPPVSL